MKKTVLLTLLGCYCLAPLAHGASGRIFLSSGDRQISMTEAAPTAPVMSDQEFNDTISRLTTTENSVKRIYLVDDAKDQQNFSQHYYGHKNSGTLDDDTAPSIAAQIASRAAHSHSVGRCALYVRKALQAAGYDFEPQVSAYMYANGILSGAGFTKLTNDNYRPQVGDVAVFNRTSRNPHGHIQIYDGSQWVSDFVQPKFSPYSQHNGYSVWRDSRYLDAANSGTYLAFNDN